MTILGCENLDVQIAGIKVVNDLELEGSFVGPRKEMITPWKQRTY